MLLPNVLLYAMQDNATTDEGQIAMNSVHYLTYI